MLTAKGRHTSDVEETIIFALAVSFARAGRQMYVAAFGSTAAVWDQTTVPAEASVSEMPRAAA
jgi:hypothetical protein